eukprot:TRINITY_DN8672_c0_g1_i2.p1 TRINITY_DN8672_c0_g1~~TRINITY_DN8672_c0_g1_i2.p1  ORF type:complete len:152 (+),score=24.48 TRINITY_DN8672_c0_g1_i2:83-538(+)
MDVSNDPTFHSDLEKGLDLMWSNKLDEAEAFFHEHRMNKTRHALHHAEVLVYRSMITELETDRTKAIEALNKTIELAESSLTKLAKNLQDPTTKNEHLDTRIALADAYAVLSTMEVLNESRVRGLLHLRKGWKIYQEILDKTRQSNLPNHL